MGRDSSPPRQPNSVVSKVVPFTDDEPATAMYNDGAAPGSGPVDPRRTPECCGRSGAASTSRAALAAYVVLGAIAATLWGVYDSARSDDLSIVSLHRLVLGPVLMAWLAREASRSLLPVPAKLPSSVSRPNSIIADSVAVVLLVVFAVSSSFDGQPAIVTAPDPGARPRLGGNCSVVDPSDVAQACVATRGGAQFVGTVDPLLGLTLDEAGEYIESLDLLRLQLVKFQLFTVTDDDVARCADFLLGEMACAAVLRNCNSTCHALPMCQDLCRMFENRCEFLVPFMGLLLDEQNLLDLRDILPEPVDYTIALLGTVGSCVGYDVPNVKVLDARNSSQCSGLDFLAGEDADAACHLDGHRSRLGRYESALLIADDDSALLRWNLRREWSRNVVCVMLWALPLCLWLARVHRMRRPLSSRPSLALAEIERHEGRADSVPQRESESSNDAPIVADVGVTVPGAVPDVELRLPLRTQSHGESARAWTAPDGDGSQRPVEAPPLQACPGRPPTFVVALSVRSCVIVVVMCVVLSVATHASYASEATGASTEVVVILHLAAILTAVRMFGAVFRWNDKYSAVVTRFCEGNLVENGGVLKRLMAWYIANFSLGGKHHSKKTAVEELLEITVQFVGLMQGAPVTSNTLVVTTVAVLSLNVVGTCALAAVPARRGGTVARSVFDLVIDCWWLGFNAATFSYSALRFTQSLSLAVPLMLAGHTLRNLFRYEVKTAAEAHCRGAGFIVIQAIADKEFDAEGSTRDLLARSGKVRCGRSTAKDAKSEAPTDAVRSPHAQCVAFCSRPVRPLIARVAVVSVICAMLAFATVTIARLVDREQACAREVGAELWHGVSETEKLFLENGLFGETSCGYNSISSIDVSGSDLAEIGPEILRFQRIAVVRAVGCRNLTSMTPLVTELPKLSTLDVSGSPISFELAWPNAGFDEFHPILLQLRDLRSLDLSGNNFTEVPRSIGSLPALQHVNFSNNPYLTGSGLRSLRLLPQLSSVDVAHCAIVSLSPEVQSAMEKWDRLDMSFNRMTAVVPAMFVPAKSSLRLHGNPIHHASLGAAGLGPDIDVALWELPLVAADFEINNVARIGSEINNVGSTLRFLWMFQNILTADGIPSLSGMHALQVAKFTANPIATDEDGGIPPGILDAPAIVELDLNCARIRSVSPLLWDMPSLEWLGLRFNPQLTRLPSPSESAMEALHLRVLDISPSGLSAVPDMLLHPPFNESLNFFRLSGPNFPNPAAWIDVVEAATRMTCAVTVETDEALDTLHCRTAEGAYSLWAERDSPDSGRTCPFA